MNPGFYLDEAERCEQAARRCIIPDNREAYLHLAEQWRSLAKDAGPSYRLFAPRAANGPTDNREMLRAAE